MKHEIAMYCFRADHKNSVKVLNSQTQHNKHRFNKYMVISSLHQGSNWKLVYYHFTNITYAILLSCKPILNKKVTNTTRLIKVNTTNIILFSILLKQSII